MSLRIRTNKDNRQLPTIPGWPPPACKNQEPTREWLRCFRKNRQQPKPCPKWEKQPG